MRPRFAPDRDNDALVYKRLQTCSTWSGFGFDGERLDELSVAYRAGRLRAGFNLYNTSEDVTRLVAAINH